MDKKKIWSAPFALIVVLTMALFFGGITVSAEPLDSGECGEEVTWSLDSNGTLTISGSGAMDNYDWVNNPGWYYDRSDIQKVVIESGITSIGNEAFAYCSNLRSVTIPSTVTTIGSAAFRSSGLESVTIPDSVTSLGFYAFEMNYSLETVSIGSGLTLIPEGAFEECTSLTAVSIPGTVTSIGVSAFNGCSGLESMSCNAEKIEGYAFYRCSALKTVDLGNKLESVGESAFEDDQQLKTITLPSTLKSIGSSAFNNIGITSLSLPSGVTSIGGGAFYSCTGLTSLELNFTTDMSIGESLFSYCSGLESVTITGNITSISAYMFSGCDNLSSLSIPATVTKIGNNAFDGCTSLNYTFPSSITSYGNYAVAGVPLTSVTISPDVTYGEGVFGYNKSLRTVTVESGVTEIPAYMFNNCSNLETVVFPETLTSIGKYAFQLTGLTSVNFPSSLRTIGLGSFYCCKLTEVTLNDGLESVGQEAFANMSGLKTVNFPDSVTTYGSRAFACTGITSVSMKIDESMNVGYGLFSGCNKLETAEITGDTTHIESGLFEDCSSLESVKLPDNLTSIPSSFFMNCKKLSSVVLPANLESINYYAFYNCSSLSSVTIPSSVTTIGENAFAGAGLTSIVIPDTVTSVGASAFNGCQKLKTVTLPSTMTTVPMYCFGGCPELTTVNFPSGLTTIESYAFAGCGFTSLSIPGTVKNINYQAFYECRKIRTLVISEGVENVNYEAFAYCTSLETAVIGSTVNPGSIDGTFDYCNNLKTIYCTSALASFCFNIDGPVINIILIDNADNIPAHIAGHSISLAADICVNFYMALPLEYDEGNTTVEFTWGEGIDFKTQKSYVHNVSATLTPINEHGANYKVTCNVAARAMGDTITMVIKSGNEEILRDTYSVIEYVNVLALAYPNDAKLQDLLTSMVAYGSYSQMYFNYKSDTDLVRYKYNNYYDTWSPSAEFYTNTVSMDVPAENLTIKNIVNDNLGLKYYGTSILCSSQTKMRFYFEVTDTDAFNAISGTASYKGVSLKFVNTKVNGQDLVYIETQGLMPGDLESIFNITIGNNVYTYDFRDYIIRVDSVDTFFVATAKGAYAYSHFAKVYQEG